MLNVAVEHGAAVTAVKSRVGLLAGGAELVTHFLLFLGLSGCSLGRWSTTSTYLVK